MLRKMNGVLSIIALLLGVWAVTASPDERTNEPSPIQSPRLSGRGSLWGMERVEWWYRGDVIVTDLQGRFCEGFRCAHGRGALETDGDWGYSGTFRYGDIVGKGELPVEFLPEDRTYSGLFSSTAYPGGPAPLCGEPEREGDFPMWPGFGIQFYADQGPCTGRLCALAHCLRAWVESVDRGETLAQGEAQRIEQWYEPVVARQAAILGGQRRRTFDKVLVGGTELREFLIGKGWRPRPDARVYVQRYRQPDMFQLILDEFETPYATNPRVQVSEMLPMALWTGSRVTAITDPWTATGLEIEINRTDYVIALHHLPQ